MSRGLIFRKLQGIKSSQNGDIWLLLSSLKRRTQMDQFEVIIVKMLIKKEMEGPLNLW